MRQPKSHLQNSRFGLLLRSRATCSATQTERLLKVARLSESILRRVYDSESRATLVSNHEARRE